VANRERGPLRSPPRQTTETVGVELQLEAMYTIPVVVYPAPIWSSILFLNATVKGSSPATLAQYLLVASGLTAKLDKQVENEASPG